VPTPAFDFYLVTDRRQTHGRDLLWVLEQALDGGGVGAVQLREKDLECKKLLDLADKARALCARYHAALLINDRIDVALAVDADGVQLGQSSLPVHTARKLLGPARMIGASTHSLQEAQEAERSGADFVLFGPVYFTPSKAAFGLPQGVAALKKVVENTTLPVYAIGGIKPDNVKEVLATGICGVALISALLAAPDPKLTSGVLRNLLRRS
jgi:thiamine-phosphate pyrophosphorylase